MVRRLRNIRIKYVNYKSLAPLFDILNSEKSYKIQIISIEPFSILTELFNYKRISYHVVFSSMLEASERNKLNIVIQDSEISVPESGKYILYSNKRNPAFIQLVFRVSLEEKIRYFNHRGSSPKKAVTAHGGTKNIVEIQNIIDGKNIGTLLPHVTYLETIVMLCARKGDFKGVCKKVSQLDGKLKNTFLVWITLNELVNRKFITKHGERFRLNISKDSLDAICKKSGLDAELF